MSFMIKLVVLAVMLSIASCTTLATTSSDPCMSNPCLNGASCLDLSDSEYVCYCANGYEGLNCETSIDSGNSSCFNGEGCQNGGFCIQNVTSIYCWCPYGYTGPHCEYSDTTTTPSNAIDPCYYSPCMNGGTCYSYYYPVTGYVYYCSCPTTTTGVNCETVIDNGGSGTVFNINFDFFLSLFNYIKQA